MHTWLNCPAHGKGAFYITYFSASFEIFRMSGGLISQKKFSLFQHQWL